MQFDFSKILDVFKATPAEAIKIAGAVVNVLKKDPALVPEIIAIATSGNIVGALASNPKVVIDVLEAVVSEVETDPAVLAALVKILEPPAAAAGA